MFTIIPLSKATSEMPTKKIGTLLILVAAIVCAGELESAEPSQQQAREAMKQAVRFFRQYASASGGYVYQLSADLAKREGEGEVGPTTAWIEPPGTPAVGAAYLDAYRLSGDPLLLESAKETADALIRGQLESGGWDNRIEYAAQDRKKYAYRVDGGTGKNLRNTTTFDDDKSQSVIRFLMQLDRELKFQDSRLHEAVVYALAGVLSSQYSCGAWPQRYSEFPDPNEGQARQASFAKSWSRTFPETKYAGFYTLNDNTMSDLIVTLLDAWETYEDERYLKAAAKGGDFLLLAQLPEPQPGWAQQYDREMHPAWARKFEPPAITGGESQGVMRTLMLLYRRTAGQLENADRFLQPLPRAIQYYRRSQLADGRLARFYELRSNRPLYFTKDYQLTYSPDDMPTHYGFIVSSKLDAIEAELSRIRETPLDKLWSPRPIRPPNQSKSLGTEVQRLIDQLDSRGAWVESGRLRYHGDDDPTRQVIRSDTFAKNLRLLAGWVAISH